MQKKSSYVQSVADWQMQDGDSCRNLELVVALFRLLKPSDFFHITDGHSRSTPAPIVDTALAGFNWRSEGNDVATGFRQGTKDLPENGCGVLGIEHDGPQRNRGRQFSPPAPQSSCGLFLLNSEPPVDA
jgi:hypothetical protein